MVGRYKSRHVTDIVSNAMSYCKKIGQWLLLGGRAMISFDNNEKGCYALNQQETTDCAGDSLCRLTFRLSLHSGSPNPEKKDPEPFCQVS